MPYYESLNWNTVSSSLITSSSSTEGEFRYEGSRDVSWRSRPVQTARSVRVLSTPSVEPYSWFLELQEFKKQSLLKTGEFDASAFRADVGHVWDNEKWSYQNPLFSCTTVNATNTSAFRNVMPAWGSSAPYPHEFDQYPTGLESWAATQYGRMAPSVSEFSLSSFLGELREGLPRAGTAFLRPRAKEFKALGDDYLNVEFGWKPFLNDLQQLALSLLEASYGLYRPFGATHRRRGAVVVDEYTRRDDGSVNFSVQVGSAVRALPSTPNPSGQFITTVPPLRGIAHSSRSRKVTRSIEGEFVYIPKAGFDPSKYMDRLETLMEVNITPSTLWQLTPWSWLIDWFSDIGDAIASMEAAVSNRVLSTYLYAMEHTVTSVSSGLAAIGPRITGTAYYGPSNYVQKLTYERKRRIRANPFGFTGSSTTHLTGEQGAILGALGLTRLK